MNKPAKRIGDDPLDDIGATVHRFPVRASAPAPAAAEPEHGPDWEARHKRVTFHVDKALWERVKAEHMRTGRSQSQIISEALVQHLGPVLPAGKRR